MHRDVHDYGVECLRYIDTLADIIEANEINTMLDYGAGKGRIVPAIGRATSRSLELSLYDPGIPQIAEPPEPAELVTCIDVLEHVEPQYTIGVLFDLARVTQKIAFITIGMHPASKFLSDGRNAHINLRSTHDWMHLLLAHFDLAYAVDKGRSLIFVGKVKGAT